jgi:uncharacterized protein
MKPIICIVLGMFFLPTTALATSFDCSKAPLTVEKLICSNNELSQLDDALAEVYSRVSSNTEHEDILKRDQRLWLKDRNKCKDVSCLHRHYSSRIADIDSYQLDMSKDDELCGHMLKLFNEDLKKYDRASDQHEEFSSIPWEDVSVSIERNGQVESENVDGALIDLNNDGVLDLVVRHQGMLSGITTNSLYILDKSAAEKTLTLREIFEANNQIALSGWFYELSSSRKGETKALWLLSPFKYRDTYYVLMRSLYMGGKAPTEDYEVISKYESGRFVMREKLGKMKDICYIRRIGVNAIR